MIPHDLKEHILGFVDFHTIVRLISVPTVYRYLLRLTKYINRRTGVSMALPLLSIVEHYYHLNGYNGLTIYDINRFINGYRIRGNNITRSLSRQLWILNSQYHRVYGPALTYGLNGTIYKCVWYYDDTIHRANYPAVTRYYDNGRPHFELYYRYDRPYSYDGKPTAIEYTIEGHTKHLYWHDAETGKVKMMV